MALVCVVGQQEVPACLLHALPACAPPDQPLYKLINNYPLIKQTAPLISVIVVSLTTPLPLSGLIIFSVPSSSSSF